MLGFAREQEAACEQQCGASSRSPSKGREQNQSPSKTVRLSRGVRIMYVVTLKEILAVCEVEVLQLMRKQAGFAAESFGGDKEELVIEAILGKVAPVASHTTICGRPCISWLRHQRLTVSAQRHCGL